MAGEIKNKGVQIEPKEYTNSVKKSINTLQGRAKVLREEIVLLKKQKEGIGHFIKDELARRMEVMEAELNKHIAPLKNLNSELMLRNREASDKLKRSLQTIEKLEGDRVEVKKDIANTALDILKKQKEFDSKNKDIEENLAIRAEEFVSINDSLDSREANIAAITAEAEAKVEKARSDEEKATGTMALARKMFAEADERIKQCSQSIASDKEAHKTYLKTSHYELDMATSALEAQKTMLKSRTRDVETKDRELNILDTALKQEALDIKQNWEAFLKEKKKHDWYNRERILP